MSYIVSYCRLKPVELVISVLLRRSDVCFASPLPPIKKVPFADLQDTWSNLAMTRVADCSHWPAIKVWQVVWVWYPPHAVNPARDIIIGSFYSLEMLVRPDWVCWYRPGEGRSGREQLRPSGVITSAECWPSPSGLQPPVTRRAVNINFVSIKNSAQLVIYLVSVESGHHSCCPQLLQLHTGSNA